MNRPAGPRWMALGLMLLVSGLVLVPAGAGASVIRGSALALPLIAGPQRPRPMFAQRAIDRAWGPSDDSVYVEVDVPEWRSEGLAAALSAAVPGAGQLYSGEGNGLWFVFAEVVGWTANRIYLHKAHVERDHAAAFAGNPADSASAWSFERWSAATGLDTDELEQIYARDPQAFYELVSTDAAYLRGWSGTPAETRDVYSGLRESVETQYDRARLAGYALWLNHLLAAVDALRATRLRNLSLQNNLDLRLRSSWHGGQPSLVVALVRRF